MSDMMLCQLSGEYADIDTLCSLVIRAASPYGDGPYDTLRERICILFNEADGLLEEWVNHFKDPETHGYYPDELPTVPYPITFELDRIKQTMIETIRSSELTVDGLEEFYI